MIIGQACVKTKKIEGMPGGGVGFYAAGFQDRSVNLRFDATLPVPDNTLRTIDEQPADAVGAVVRKWLNSTSDAINGDASILDTTTTIGPIVQNDVQDSKRCIRCRAEVSPPEGPALFTVTKHWGVRENLTSVVFRLNTTSPTRAKYWRPLVSCVKIPSDADIPPLGNDGDWALGYRLDVGYCFALRIGIQRYSTLLPLTRNEVTLLQSQIYYAENGAIRVWIRLKRPGVSATVIDVQLFSAAETGSSQRRRDKWHLGMAGWIEGLIFEVRSDVVTRGTTEATAIATELETKYWLA